MAKDSRGAKESVSQQVWYLYGSPDTDHLRVEAHGVGSESSLVLVSHELRFTTVDQHWRNRILATIPTQAWLSIAEEIDGRDSKGQASG